MKQVHPPRKTQPENRDNKKETHLPDATTVQNRPIKNKCVTGDSNMRGLATKIKFKTEKSGNGMSIQDFGYENSTPYYSTTRIC